MTLYKVILIRDAYCDINCTELSLFKTKENAIEFIKNEGLKLLVDSYVDEKDILIRDDYVWSRNGVLFITETHTED